MKIFVTGGAGFIGSNFIRYVLQAKNSHAIVNYDKLTYAGNLANLHSVAQHPGYQFVKGDICDPIAAEAAMRGCDAVVHFAAESHVDRSIYEPAPVIQTNVTGTFTLLEIARKLDLSRFVHISTDEVYGDIAPGAFAGEDFPLQPSSPYSASKAASDLLVRLPTHYVHTCVCLCRSRLRRTIFPQKCMHECTPWVAGLRWRMPFSNVGNMLCFQQHQERSGNGHQPTNWLEVGTVVER
jgi:dTDP-glucose 4,6-dehydratase